MYCCSKIETVQQRAAGCVWQPRACYSLPVRLPYIVIKRARIDAIKGVCSELPCCQGAFLDLLSVHDNFGDEDGILRDILLPEK